MEKIKYVLNGKTKYYSEDELREYYKNLLKNNDVYFEGHFDTDFAKLLQDLEEYDGDPYGDIKGKKTWKMLHNLEDNGWLLVFP